MFLKLRGRFVKCLIIYVDDMIIKRNDVKEISRIREYIFTFTEYEMKDLGKLK